MKKTIFFFLFAINLLFAQDYGNDSEALKLCSVLQTNNFGTDVEAENTLDKILNVIGASKRFVLQPCSNINNAVATSYKGIRYILYDRDFMNSLSYGNNWGNLFVLAHEVGHHINGHSLDLVLYAADAVGQQTLAQSRQDELEADEFAGFILAKLGGPLSAAIQSITSISSNRDDTYSTHPNREKRLAAVRKGFNTGNESSFVKKSDLSEEYFYKAVDAHHNSNYPKAIENITVAIALKGNDYRYYSLKGDIHGFNNEYLIAIESYKKGIELNPKAYWNYSAIGYMYNILNDESEKKNPLYDEQSEKYFLQSIKISPTPRHEDFYQLGRLYFDQKKLTNAISYLTQSINIKPTGGAYFYRALSNGFSGNNYESIADFTSSINLTDDIARKALSYYFRGIGKGQIGDTSGYCDDLKQANILDPGVGMYIDNENCN